MAIHIFYSWQNDTENTVNRFFIRDILKEAIKDYKDALELDERPYLDYDTKDVPGNPEIFNTILKKIEACDIFIADVTFISKSEGGKLIPNPNVMIELGYALKVVGSERTILVMNEEYGSPEGNLPFDLKHRRWPLRYKAASNLNKSQLAAISSKFASEIKSAIKAILRQNGAKISQEQIGEHDRQLFTLFLKDFPSQGRATIFLRDHDIGGRFRSSDLNEIYDFLHTWNNAEHEFNNPELEKKRQALWDALNMFSQELGQHTSMTHRDGWLSIDLRDFEDRPERIEIRDNLNALATKAYQAHQDFIRVGKRYF